MRNETAESDLLMEAFFRLLDETPGEDTGVLGAAGGAAAAAAAPRSSSSSSQVSVRSPEGDRLAAAAADDADDAAGSPAFSRSEAIVATAEADA